MSPEHIPVTTWVRETRNAKTASSPRRLCPCFFLWPDSIRAPNPSLNSICGRPRRSRCLGNPASDSATASYVRHARLVYEPLWLTTALTQSQARRVHAGQCPTFKPDYPWSCTYCTARSNEMRYFCHAHNLSRCCRPIHTSDGLAQQRPCSHVNIESADRIVSSNVAQSDRLPIMTC